MKRRSEKTKRVTTGGATACSYCKKLCSYGHRCPGCNKVFHNLCMLSLLEGTKTLCTFCFEKAGLPPKDLDSHDHTPYSPTCPIPYHPFTKRYAAARNLLNSTPNKTEVQVLYIFCSVLSCLLTPALPHIGFRVQLV